MFPFRIDSLFRMNRQYRDDTFDRVSCRAKEAGRAKTVYFAKVVSSSSILRDSDQADQSIPAARYLLLEYVRN